MRTRQWLELAVLGAALAAGAEAKDSGKLFVSSEKDNAMAVVDAAKGEVVGSQPLCKRPRHMQLTPDRLQLLVACSDDHRVLVWDIAGGELWVSNEIDGSVSIIRTADHTVQGSIGFKPQGMRPEDITPVGMALAPDGRTAYVGLGRANHVAVVDVASRQVKGYVLVGKRAWGLALSRDGKRLYVANGLSDDLTIVDTDTMKGIKTLKVGRVPYGVVVDD